MYIFFFDMYIISFPYNLFNDFLFHFTVIITHLVCYLIINFLTNILLLLLYRHNVLTIHIHYIYFFLLGIDCIIL